MELEAFDTINNLNLNNLPTFTLRALSDGSFVTLGVAMSIVLTKSALNIFGSDWQGLSGIEPGLQVIP